MSKSYVAKDKAQLPHRDLNIAVPQLGCWDEDTGEVRGLARLIVWTVILLGAIAGAVYSLGRFIFRM